MVQIFVYFKHIEIMQNLEPTKLLAEITQFFLVCQRFIHYGTPEVPVNMVPAYHHFDSERSMIMSRKCELAQHVSQRVWLEGPRNSKN